MRHEHTGESNNISYTNLYRNDNVNLAVFSKNDMGGDGPVKPIAKTAAKRWAILSGVGAMNGRGRNKKSQLQRLQSIDSSAKQVPFAQLETLQKSKSKGGKRRRTRPTRRSSRKKTNKKKTRRRRRRRRTRGGFKYSDTDQKSKTKTKSSKSKTTESKASKKKKKKGKKAKK